MVRRPGRITGHRWRARALVCMAICCFAASLAAAEIRVTVRTPAGAAVRGAVVELRSPATAAPLPRAAGDTPVIRQRDQRFVPEVVAIKPGDSVRFPNDDPVMHHVYSLSPTKPFELPLYGNDEIPAIAFEREGIVRIGCNIHDNMRGYIYISDAYAFGVTADDGAFTFGQVAAGDYDLTVWHPRMRDGDRVGERALAVTSGERQAVDVTVDARPRHDAGTNRYERGGYD